MEQIQSRILAIQEAMTEICANAIKSTENEALFHNVCNTLVDRGIYAAASIEVVDKEILRAKTVAQTGLTDFPNEFLLSDLPDIERGSPYVCNDLLGRVDNSLWPAEAASHGFLSMAVLPIKMANNIALLFSLYSRSENTFTDEEFSALEKLENIISDTLVHMKLDAQKRRAQIELQRSEAIYSRIAERMVGMICEVDDHGTITFVSESEERVLGFEPGEMIGKPLASFVDPEYLDAFDGALRSLSGNQTTAKTELKMKRSDAEFIWVELVSHPIEDETRRVSGFVIAIRDITDIREQVADLQKQIRDLEDRVKERTERIRTLSEASNQRVGIAIKQINHISQMRDRLRKNPELKSGFPMILKSAIQALGMDAGGIFLLSPDDSLIETRAIVPGRNSISKTIYKPDESFLEFESLHQKEPSSRLGAEGQSLLGTEAIHCAPISLSKSIRGFVALGSDGRRTLDESDLTILKLYSALIAELVKTTIFDVQPAKETVKPIRGTCRLDSGNAYLVPDNVALAYELFLEAIMSGTEGLCITRTMPARIREKHGLQRTPIIWLTDEAVEGEKTIHNLQDVSILISNYAQRASKPVILIDGIEYLISHKGFGSVYHLLQSKRTQMEASHGILIVPFFRDAMEAKETKLLEREFRLFGTTRERYGTIERPIPTQIPNDIY